MVREETPYNPLAKKNLGVSVADAMLERAPERLPLDDVFVGAGIYALYYVGDFPLYRRIAESNCDGQFKWPIYVGKAVPPGSRRGGFGLGENPGTVLAGRIRQHSRSIEQARNLTIGDFFCRYLVVEDIWIPLGESLLIQRFSPVWNKVLDGFGSHDVGSGRYNQEQSAWDLIHPGREWAAKCTPSRRQRADVIKVVEEFIAQHAPSI